MSLKSILCATAATLTLAGAAYASEAIKIMDPYARSSRPGAPTGAAFMGIMNMSGEDDVLINASSDIAKRVELHTHIDDGNGVMQMRHDEDGFPIPAGGTHMLKRGGDHVMFMGLNESLEQGGTVTVTLTFEKAGDVVIEIPVDLERQDGHGHGSGHGHMNHGDEQGDTSHSN
ncbi:MAG: copper chaperone PCu(A)C [Rhodobacteraceae bacterium]|nr:copper chaperone PCu(A)C [Paracoccaceae bacterium]